MSEDDIKKEFIEFRNWPSDNDNFCSTKTTTAFAKHCVEIALKREREKDKDDLK